MVMNKTFLIRAKVEIEKTVMNETDTMVYFSTAFGQDSALSNEFINICKKGLKEPFMEMVHRESRVKKWADFLRHEQGKADSRWNRPVLENLPDRLENWYKSLTDPDPAQCLDLVLKRVNVEIRKHLRYVDSNDLVDIETKERLELGLRAFRTMTWRLRSGV